jgi:hypothetical protein
VRPLAVAGIALGMSGKDLGLRLTGVRRPPSGALVRRCREEDLEGSVGTHDGADVSPLRDVAARRYQRSLALDQRLADLGMDRDPRGCA